ncbi:hypothetical protein SISNIDRAFT_488568 [Sistotremastrum niveocremeum HHB9708]|uniref:SNF2-family ATP dependent chromatin remodeling factor snf21 n=1 Tax=Sistotremastrum niveocremeum HHB9708 TaxID=1314777 RepID=A0A164R9G6_9AGAM|nr:hypothetical protein SISNIDRAFT_488568 [Sistotremastrum niveocremeum HHB9708]
MAAPDIMHNGPQDFAKMGMTKDRMMQIFQRARALQQAGHTPETSAELARYTKFMHAFQAQSRGQGQPVPAPAINGSIDGLAGHQPLLNGTAPHIPNGAAPSTNPLDGPIPPNQYPPSPQSPVAFSSSQAETLRAQIAAFKHISRAMPIPDIIKQAALAPTFTLPEGELQNINGKTQSSHEDVKTGGTENGDATEDAMKTDGDDANVPRGPFLEDQRDSGFWPYNAFTHPSTFFQQIERDPLASLRGPRLLVPSLMPTGLDPHQIIAERNRFIDARIQYRIEELSNLPSTIGEGGLDAAGIPSKLKNSGNDQETQDDQSKAVDRPKHTHPGVNVHGKTRAMIELKALSLLHKQRVMRAQVVERLTHGVLVPVDRKDLRRFRKPTIRDARQTEQLERKQRQDRERRAKQKHLDYLAVICQHGQENVIGFKRTQQNKAIGIGKRVLTLHSQTEKEEQKRIERISKERLRALRADDEEAYLKLIDTAKDTRITHLLQQTDQYLDSLAQAVMAQQGEDMQHHAITDVDETTFGAQKMADEQEDKSKVDYYAVAHRITEKVTKQPSLLVGGTLKDYQLKGLQWMVSLYNNRLNGILADEMGLGKTIQTISLITFLIEVKRQPGPYLVIVPLSTMTNWTGEFMKWAPTVPLISYKGSPPVRRQLQGQLRHGQFQVVLTTYEYIIKDRPVLGKIKWLHMIIDEGHRMKNTQSKLSQTLSQFYHSRYRLILTGTPLQNNLPELWALLNFVLPKIFDSVKSFDEWFNTPFATTGAQDQMRLNEEESLLVIKRLHKVLRPFLLRRLKKDVESELPDKVEKVVKIKMSALQSQLYKQMKKYKQIASGPAGKEKAVKGLNNELMQLRKICQHPFLFNTVEDTISPGPSIDDSIIRTSGKFEMLSKILPKFFATGHRVLIFFQMTLVMDIMSDFLRSRGWEFLRLDGGTKPEERADYVKMFNDPASKYQVFILSTRAGGLGLNLQSADTVIIFDSDWNPHADLQAQDRAHRIGQTKAVRILRFIQEKSVEEAMFARARFKLGMDEKVIQAGRFDNRSTQEDSDEMLRAILEADQEADETEESGDMNDDEINELIARSDEEIRYFREMDIERERAAEERWRAAGNRGPRPAPLMQLEELPLCWRSDNVLDVKEDEEKIEGRGARKRREVNYNDGLTDEQFALAVEEEEDLDELMERNRERKERRAQNKLIRERDDSATPGPDGDYKGKRSKGKGRARDDYEVGIIGSVKRKRGGKDSATPSINGDADDSRDAKRRKTTAKVPAPDPQTMQRMKKIFTEVHQAVLACVDETGRKRCELFKDLPDKKASATPDYPDYYTAIKQPISMNQIRKRASTGTYKTVRQYRDDWALMFNNARTYNQEGSWVYVDAEEMEKVCDEVFNRLTIGSGLPGADSGGFGQAASSPIEEERPPAPRSARSSARPTRQVVSSDEDDNLSAYSDDG